MKYFSALSAGSIIILQANGEPSQGIPWENNYNNYNLQRLFPKPFGQGSRGAIDTHSDFRKRSLLNAEMVSYSEKYYSKRQSTGKEFDTYKVGTAANSTSTMHRITSKPITIDCFEADDLCEINFEGFSYYQVIGYCELLRQKYSETKDKRYWKELIRWLPESWLQTRTVTMSYENLYSMVRQRQNHKLNEWSGKDNATNDNFISFVRSLPYADDFLFI